jgi:hypothetical protein
MKVSTSCSASSIIAASFGNFGRNWSVTMRHCVWAVSAVSCAKIVLISANTICRCPLLA